MTDIMKLFIKDAVENMFKTDDSRSFNDDIKYTEGSVKYTIREGGVYYNELMLDINYLEAVKVSEELSKNGIQAEDGGDRTGAHDSEGRMRNEKVLDPAAGPVPGGGACGCRGGGVGL